MRDEKEEKFRLDKWLWAARFFKTRSLAADAIDGGKVRVESERVKVAKEVKVGMQIQIRTKEIEIELVVLALSQTRRGAPEAALLYQETPESQQKRELLKATKSDQHALRDRGLGRPTKRQLRDIQKFTGGW